MIIVKIILIIMAVVAAVATIYFGTRTAVGLAIGSTKAFVGGNLLLCLIGIAGTIALATTAIKVTAQTDAQKTEDQESAYSTMNITETEPELPPEELPENAFYVDLSQEDLRLWLVRKLGVSDLAEMRHHFSYKCLPSYRDDRVKSSRAAMQLYYEDKTKVGFSDPVLFAMPDKVIIMARDGKFPSDYDTLEEYLDDAIIIPMYKEILVNPVYAEMWVQWLLEYAKEFPIILERNPWLLEFEETLDEFYARTEVPIGLQNLLEMKTSLTDENVLTEWYMDNAAKLIYLLDGFDCDLQHPVRQIKSTISWHMPLCGEANLCRTERLEDKKSQESEPALLLIFRYKSGNVAMRGGINMFDERAEIFPSEDPTPTRTPPTTETTVTTTVTTTPPPETEITTVPSSVTTVTTTTTKPTPKETTTTTTTKPTPPRRTTTTTTTAPPITVPPITSTTTAPPVTEPVITTTTPDCDPDDSNGNQNTNHPGGDLDHRDGPGEYQTSTPTVYNVPEETTAATSSSTAVTTVTTAVTDPSGGNVDGGTPPATNPIPVNTDSVFHDPDGSSVPAVSDPVNHGTVAEPD